MVRAPRKNKNPQRIPPISETESYTRNHVDQPDFTFSSFGSGADETLNIDESRIGSVNKVENVWRMMNKLNDSTENKDAANSRNHSKVEDEADNEQRQSAPVPLVGTDKPANPFMNKDFGFSINGPAAILEAYNIYSASLDSTLLSNMVKTRKAGLNHKPPQNTARLPFHMQPVGDAICNPNLREQLANTESGTSNQSKFLYPVKMIPAPPQPSSQASFTGQGQFQQFQQFPFNLSFGPPTNDPFSIGSTNQFPMFEASCPPVQAPNSSPERYTDSASLEVPVLSNLVPVKRSYVKYTRPADTRNLPSHMRPVGHILREQAHQRRLAGIPLRPTVKSGSESAPDPPKPAQRQSTSTPTANPLKDEKKLKS